MVSLARTRRCRRRLGGEYHFQIVLRTEVKHLHKRAVCHLLVGIDGYVFLATVGFGSLISQKGKERIHVHLHRFAFIGCSVDRTMFVNIDARGRFQCRLLGTLGQIDLQGCRKYERRGELKDMVCSPGGTTIEAVKVLEEGAMRATIMKAMEACIEKSKRL